MFVRLLVKGAWRLASSRLETRLSGDGSRPDVNGRNEMAKWSILLRRRPVARVEWG